MRVVSLLPSATELLAAAGGIDLLVGRSHECDEPAGLDGVPVLTRPRTRATTSAAIDAEVSAALGAEGGAASLYELDAERLVALAPDVILTQDLCAVCSIDTGTVRAAAAGMARAPEIVTLNPASIEDVFDDLLTVGRAIGREAAAHTAMVALRERYWTAVDHVNPYADGPEVAFLEWMDPPFCAGHWTPALIRAAGGRHSLNEPGAPSRRLAPEELLAVMPDRLIVCPCGYDLAAIRRELPDLARQRWWPLLPAVREGRAVMVDGNAMFNRPGPRLVDAFRWLVAWINDRPEVAPEDFPVQALDRPAPDTGARRTPRGRPA